MSGPVLVSLGSNLEPETQLPRAVALLRERLVVRAVSAVYRSAPVAGASGPDFLNAAAWVETELPPAVLKHEVLRPIEARLGRLRAADRNAPRTIDLDLVLYGALVLDDPARGLVLPDPDILVWPHVARPLADLAPDFVHPIAGRTLGEIAAALAGAGGLWQMPWPGIE